MTNHCPAIRTTERKSGSSCVNDGPLFCAAFPGTPLLPAPFHPVLCVRWRFFLSIPACCQQFAPFGFCTPGYARRLFNFARMCAKLTGQKRTRSVRTKITGPRTRAIAGVGCQHPATFSGALLAAFWAEIGLADFDAGESGVSFAGSHRAHISPQCGLNGVLGVFHFRLILPPFSNPCFFSGSILPFLAELRTFYVFHFPLFCQTGGSHTLPYILPAPCGISQFAAR